MALAWIVVQATRPLSWLVVVALATGCGGRSSLAGYDGVDAAVDAGVVSALPDAAIVAVPDAEEEPPASSDAAPFEASILEDSEAWDAPRDAEDSGGPVTVFSFPAGSDPWAIAPGPDGNLWVTEPTANKIGRITTTGVIVEFPVPTAGSSPEHIAAGPDGNVWFTELRAGQIARIAPSGAITEFPLPNPYVQPAGITAGPDGNVWFAEFAVPQIGRITPSGTITEFAVPVASGVPRPGPWGIAAGSDGNLWFTEEGDLQGIGTITTDGTITLLATKPPGSSWGLAGESDKIAAGPDGALWFTEDNGNVIGRITTSGSVTEYPLPEANRFPMFVAPGPDGNVWFTELARGHIGTITPSGAITEVAIPGFTESTVGITAGPDGNMWFVEYDKGAIGRVKP